MGISTDQSGPSTTGPVPGPSIGIDDIIDHHPKMNFMKHGIMLQTFTTDELETKWLRKNNPPGPYEGRSLITANKAPVKGWLGSQGIDLIDENHWWLKPELSALNICRRVGPWYGNKAEHIHAVDNFNEFGFWAPPLGGFIAAPTDDVQLKWYEPVVDCRINSSTTDPVVPGIFYAIDGESMKVIYAPSAVIADQISEAPTNPGPLGAIVTLDVLRDNAERYSTARIRATAKCYTSIGTYNPTTKTFTPFTSILDWVFGGTNPTTFFAGTPATQITSMTMNDWTQDAIQFTFSWTVDGPFAGALGIVRNLFIRLESVGNTWDTYSPPF